MRLFGVALVLALAGAACTTDDGGAVQPPPTGDSAEVTGTVQNRWDPDDATIVVGGTVRWSWAGGERHDVTAVDGSFDSGEPVVEDTFEHTFNQAGTFEYYCTIHGTEGGVGMFGTITVEEA